MVCKSVFYEKTFKNWLDVKRVMMSLQSQKNLVLYSLTNEMGFFLCEICIYICVSLTTMLPTLTIIKKRSNWSFEIHNFFLAILHEYVCTFGWYARIWLAIILQLSLVGHTGPWPSHTAFWELSSPTLRTFLGWK